jgi:hypothetical protein
MNTKFIVAGLAGGVFAFLAGWLIYGILLMDFMMANTTMYDGLMKDPPDMAFLVVSNLAWGFLFSYVYQKWANIQSFGAGFSGGLAISFFIITAFDTGIYAFYNLTNLTGTLIDIVVGTIWGGLTAGVVGFVLGYGRKEG